MAKIQQFKNKPSPNSFGQYYYDNNDMNNFQPLEESDSVMKPVDKFSDKTLHSNVVTDYTRDFIVDKKLRYSGVSGIKINNIEITENNTGPNPHIDNYFSGYICDRNTFDCFDNNGIIRGYRTLFQYFRYETDFYEGLRDYPNTGTPPPVSSNRRFQFFKYQPGQIGDKGAPDMSFLNDKFIVKGITVNANDPIEAYPGDYQDSENIELRRGLAYFRNYLNNGNEQGWTSEGHQNELDRTERIPFQPMDDVAREDRLTATFSENTVNSDEENYIQIIIFTKANHSGKTRRRNFGVVKINPSDILDLSGDVATAGELANTPISFTWDDFQKVEGYEHGYVSGRDKTAWYVSNLSVTFHVDSGVNPDTFPQDEETQTILATVEPRVRINENNFDIDFTKINLLQESTTYATSYGSFWKRNFTPFSEVTINNRLDKNLQGFKTNDLDRQICSSPTNISLKVDVAKYEQYSNNDSVIIQRAYPPQIPPHYKVCVIHWNDINDEFTTVEDVFDKKPTNFAEVIEAQDNNTFIFKDYSETFNHNYTTPGIKKIKILIFSYMPFGQETWNNNYKNSEMPPFDRIEPIRYKLLTSRIFLDIPISEFEDFFELGGTEYRTIPWPHTTPVIGGISNDSKYLKSIDDILGSGKIGDTDIIDERFLLESKENNELGKNIESMDLEQCRYFDKNYSMYDLLDIPLMVDYEYYSGVLPIPTLEDGSDVWDYDSDDLILEYNTELTEYTAQCNDSFGNSGRGEEFLTTIEGLYNHIECSNNGTCQTAMDVMDLSQWYKFKFTYMGTEVGSEDENETIGAVGLRFQMGVPSEFPGKKHRIHADDWDRESGPNGEPPSPYFGTEIAYQMTNGDITFRIYDSGGQPRDDFFEKANCTIGEECVIWIQLQPSFDGVEPTQHTITLHNGKNFNKTKWKNMSLERADLIGEQVESGFMPYDNFNYWNGSSPQQSYSDDISIGQIFINDNSDLDLKQSCKLELNTGELTGKSIYDSSGNSNKGMLIGDYKIKKTAKGQTMRRDSFIKVPKKANNNDGAL